MGWETGACRFLGVDLKPEGPSLCSHGLTKSLSQSTVPTHVGVCMSVCVCTVCACVYLCVRASMDLCTQGMGAVCRWGSFVPSPRHKSPQTHSWVRKHWLSCFCLVSLTEFWGTVEQRLGPRTCVPSATCGADTIGPVRTLTDEQGEM